MSNLRDFYSGGSSSDLTWEIVSTNITASSNKGYLLDNSTAEHTITLPVAPSIGDTVAVSDLNGNFGINSCTIDPNSLKIHGITEDIILDTKNQRVTLVYSGTTDGWIITDLEPNGSQWEYMPYAVMHVQEQKPYNTDGGTTSSGNNTRILNTVLFNDISGASLNAATGEVTLQPGTYDFFGQASQDEDSVSVGLRTEILDSTGAVLLRGANIPRYGGVGIVSGVVTFASATVIRLNSYTTQGHATTGFGNKSLGTVEVYADLKITKIGGNYAPKPVISAVRLQPMVGLDVTGGVIGFDISKTGANQITVTKGTTLDSNLTVALALTANTAVTIPSVANTIYHIAVVRLLNQTITVKAYASEAAIAADVGVNIDTFRWIGFWRTNGSSQCMEGLCVDGVMGFLKPSETVISSGFSSTSYVALTLTGMVPVSRVTEIYPGIASTVSNDVLVFFSNDGVNATAFCYGYSNLSDTGRVWGHGSSSFALRSFPISGGVMYAKAEGGSANIGVAQVKLRR